MGRARLASRSWLGRGLIPASVLGAGTACALPGWGSGCACRERMQWRLFKAEPAPRAEPVPGIAAAPGGLPGDGDGRGDECSQSPPAPAQARRREPSRIALTSEGQVVTATHETRHQAPPSFASRRGRGGHQPCPSCSVLGRFPVPGARPSCRVCVFCALPNPRPRCGGSTSQTGRPRPAGVSLTPEPASFLLPRVPGTFTQHGALALWPPVSSSPRRKALGPGSAAGSQAQSSWLAGWSPLTVPASPSPGHQRFAGGLLVPSSPVYLWTQAPGATRHTEPMLPPTHPAATLSGVTVSSLLAERRSQSPTSSSPCVSSAVPGSRDPRPERWTRPCPQGASSPTDSQCTTTHTPGGPGAPTPGASPGLVWSLRGHRYTCLSQGYFGCRLRS